MQLADGKNADAVYDDEKKQYECVWPERIVRAWECGVLGRELPVPQVPKPEPKP